MHVSETQKSLMPLFVFLVAQTIAAVWWAAQLQTSFQASAEQFRDFRKTQVEEQLRQTQDIKANSVQITAAITNDESMRRELNLMRGSMNSLVEEIRQHNDLMRALQRELQDASPR